MCWYDATDSEPAKLPSALKVRLLNGAVVNLNHGETHSFNGEPKSQGEIAMLAIKKQNEQAAREWDLERPRDEYWGVV